MTVKLNLTIEEKLVAKTKNYASKKGTSVSRLVEKLLVKELSENIVKSNFVEKFAGVLTDKLNDKNLNDYKDQKSKKYGY